MNIKDLSKLAQTNLEQIINNEVSNSKAKNTTHALGRVLSIELAKIKYQTHIGTVEKIPFFEKDVEEVTE